MGIYISRPSFQVKGNSEVFCKVIFDDSLQQLRWLGVLTILETKVPTFSNGPYDILKPKDYKKPLPMILRRPTCHPVHHLLNLYWSRNDFWI